VQLGEKLTFRHAFVLGLFFLSKQNISDNHFQIVFLLSCIARIHDYLVQINLTKGYLFPTKVELPMKQEPAFSSVVQHFHMLVCSNMKSFSFIARKL